MARTWLWASILALALAGCGGDDDERNDVGGFVMDSGVADTGPLDTGPEDAGPEDAEADLCEGVDCTALDDQCVVGVCNPADGTCEAQVRPDDTPCDDGDMCTTGNVCQAGECSAGTAVDCTALDDQCVVGVCNPADGACEARDRPDDTPCDDGDMCTTANVCLSGQCSPGTPVDCTALDDACVVGVCNPADGECETRDRPDDTPCTDGDACTLGDACQSGTCTSTGTVDCSALDGACVIGACDSADGSCRAENRPDDTPCTDGDACTLGDACQSGTCTSTGTVDCTALDGACVVGVCDASDGSCAAQNRPDDSPCTDNDACTLGDACQSGTCTSTGTLDCSSLNGNCVIGACDSATGCVAQAAPMSTPCTDGNRCTTMDMCDSTGLCLGQIGACGPGILASESFDADAGGFTAGGSSSSWARGVPSGTFITAETSTDAEWVTNLSGDYNNNEDSYIESPAYDFGPLTADPVLEFSHIYETESGWDFGWVETSTDGGSSWTKLGQAGDGVNWYNRSSNDTWDGTSGGAGARRTAGIIMTGFAGLSDVRIRFRLDSDGSSTREGFSVDDFRIREPVVDLAVDSVTLPDPTCGAVAGPVTVLIANPGGVPQSGFTVSATGIGGMAVTETVNQTVPAYGTLSYTFGATMNVSTQSTVTVRVNASGDTDLSNDSVSQQSGVPVPQITVSAMSGYAEGFEAGAGNWTIQGTNPSWAVGTPTGGFIDAASGGSTAAATNLSGAYNNSELSYLVSPCLDLRSFTTDPVIAFSHIYETESCCDETWVETSTTGGASWTKLGASSGATNWYNDTGNQWWDGTSGSAGAWRPAGTTLSGTAGRSGVRVRFVMSTDGSVTRDGVGVDDVEIYDPNVSDLSVESVSLPSPGCGVVQGSVSAVIRNRGNTDQSNFGISATGFGGSTVSETVTQTVPALGTLTYTFGTQMNVSSAGSVTVTVNLTGDADPSNDSASAQASPLPLVTVGGAGYTEGFESGAGGWTVSGANPSWAVGTPSGSFITGANAGTGAAVTNLTGSYNNSERSYLESPCFDLSGVGTDPDLSFAHIFETESCCDETWVETSTTGGSSWTKLGASSTASNWYNDTSNQWWDGTSGTAGTWRSASTTLSGAAGSSAVRVRFVMSTDGSVTREGVGIDDVTLSP